MVQFNLLPAVKLEYLQAKRLLRLVMSIAALAAGTVFILAVVLSVYVYLLQRHNISNLNGQINSAKLQLSRNTNLNKILTVQNQLESLPSLESQSPVTSRLFDYLSELTPVNADITNFSIDYTQDTMEITGSADSLVTVNQYVDTLKFTTYALNGQDTHSDAFSSVVLSSFGISQNVTNGKPASYIINCSFNPIIFNVADNASLHVPPNFITTRSITQQPKLFVAVPKSTSTTQGGANG